MAGLLKNAINKVAPIISNNFFLKKDKTDATALISYTDVAYFQFPVSYLHELNEVLRKFIIC